jgi:hypothetical protein
MRAVLAVALLVTGCAPQPAFIDARLSDSWHLLGTVAPWRDDVRFRRAVVADIPGGHSATYGSGVITVSPAALASMPVEEIAAILAHELRHAQGYGHGCGLYRDSSHAERGAWAVHIEVLESLGVTDSAAYLRETAFCEHGRDLPWNHAGRALPR